MKVYLAARFGRIEEMRKLSKSLEILGIELTSRWVIEEEGINPSYEKLQEKAFMDALDVKRCDILVRFSDDLKSSTTVPSEWCTSSRFEETGMAYAWGKKIVIVGNLQSLFDRFPDRMILKDNEALMEYLKQEQKLMGYELAEEDKFGEDDNG